MTHHVNASNTVYKGRFLLTSGIVVYLIAIGACAAAVFSGMRTDAIDRATWLLFGIPMALPGIIFGLVIVVFLVSSLTGLPLIRFSNGLATIERNWQSIVGATLLMSALCALLATLTS